MTVFIIRVIILALYNYLTFMNPLGIFISLEAISQVKCFQRQKSFMTVYGYKERYMVIMLVLYSNWKPLKATIMLEGSSKKYFFHIIIFRQNFSYVLV